MPTTIVAPLPRSYTGPNPLAQLHQALLRWAESNPTIQVRPLSPAVDDSTEAESVDSILDDSAGNSPASLLVESSDPEEWYVPGHDVWPDSCCSTAPVPSGSDEGEKTPSPATTPAASVGGDSHLLLWLRRHSPVRTTSLLETQPRPSGNLVGWGPKSPRQNPPNNFSVQGSYAKHKRS